MKKSIAMAALVSGLAFGEESPASERVKTRTTDSRPALMAATAAAGAAVEGFAALISDRIIKKRDAENTRTQLEWR